MNSVTNQLTVLDVALIEQIIRVCQARGAFKPEEMIDIGTLYKKLVLILEPHINKEESKLPTIFENS